MMDIRGSIYFGFLAIILYINLVSVNSNEVIEELNNTTKGCQETFTTCNQSCGNDTSCQNVCFLKKYQCLTNCDTDCTSLYSTCKSDPITIHCSSVISTCHFFKNKCTCDDTCKSLYGICLEFSSNDTEHCNSTLNVCQGSCSKDYDDSICDFDFGKCADVCKSGYFTQECTEHNNSYDHAKCITDNSNCLSICAKANKNCKEVILKGVQQIPDLVIDEYESAAEGLLLFKTKDDVQNEYSRYTVIDPSDWVFISAKQTYKDDDNDPYDHPWFIINEPPEIKTEEAKNTTDSDILIDKIEPVPPT